MAEMEGKKKWQLICGNVVAGMEGKKKKRIVPMELPKMRERIVWIKKIFWILILKSTPILILSMCQ